MFTFITLNDNCSNPFPASNQAIPTLILYPQNKLCNQNKAAQTIWRNYNNQLEMFRQQTNLPAHNGIKVYLRLKDKKSFLISLKEPIILGELKQLILKKTKINQHDLIVMYQGNQINFTHQLKGISLKDMSILHIINRKNIRNDFIEIMVKFILTNQKQCLGETNLVAKSDDSIQDFIHSKIIPVLLQMTGHKTQQSHLNLVLNGSILQKNLNFKNYLIEDGAEIICMVKQIQASQKITKPIPTNDVAYSHQSKLSAPSNISNYQNNSPVELNPAKHTSQIQKKPSVSLSQNPSQQFVKLNKFQSNDQLLEKQRLLNEATKTYGHESKLKKKQKINSDLARKFEHLLSTQNQPKIQTQNTSQISNPKHQENLPQGDLIPQLQSKPKYKGSSKKTQDKSKSSPQLGDFILITNPSRNTSSRPFNNLALKFSQLLNNNVPDEWQDEPSSPIEVQYPKIQKRGPSLVEWDPTTSQIQIEEKSDRYAFSEKASSTKNQPNKLQDTPFLQQKANTNPQITEPSAVQVGDFLAVGCLRGQQENQASKNFTKQLSQRFNNLIDQRKGSFQRSSISVEQPKLQKRAELKAGDLIMCGQLQINENRFINQNILSKFQNELKKINKRRNQAYGVIEESREKSRQLEHSQIQTG